MPADIRCPRCTSVSNEMMECDNCQDIGCNRCMRRSQGRWIHHQCNIQPEPQSNFTNALTTMFG